MENSDAYTYTADYSQHSLDMTGREHIGLFTVKYELTFFDPQNSVDKWLIQLKDPPVLTWELVLHDCKVLDFIVP